MALKSYKPITPSLRQLVIVDRTGLWKGKPVKALTVGKHNTGGRNNHGHITSNHMGGGHKRRLRIVDFKRRKFDVAATVERLIRAAGFEPLRVGGASAAVRIEMPGGDLPQYGSSGELLDRDQARAILDAKEVLA